MQFDEKIIKEFEDHIPYYVDTGSGICCLLEQLMCTGSWTDEWEDDEFLAWIKDKDFTKNEIKHILKILDGMEIIAINPYTMFIEVEAFHPGFCRQHRRYRRLNKIELKYGKIDTEIIRDTQIVDQSYFTIKDLKTNEPAKEYLDIEGVNKILKNIYGVTHVDIREFRKGKPSRFDELDIRYDMRKAAKTFDEAITFIWQPDGTKLYKGKLFDKLVRILEQYEI